MPADATAAVDREVSVDQDRKLLRHVIVHPVISRPWLARGVHVKTGARAKIPVVVLAGYIGATRTRVRADDGDTEFGGHPLCAGLEHEVFVGASQTG